MERGRTLAIFVQSSIQWRLHAAPYMAHLKCTVPRPVEMMLTLAMSGPSLAKQRPLGHCAGIGQLENPISITVPLLCPYPWQRTLGFPILITLPWKTSFLLKGPPVRVIATQPRAAGYRSVWGAGKGLSQLPPSSGALSTASSTYAKWLMCPCGSVPKLVDPQNGRLLSGLPLTNPKNGYAPTKHTHTHTLIRLLSRPRLTNGPTLMPLIWEPSHKWLPAQTSRKRNHLGQDIEGLSLPTWIPPPTSGHTTNWTNIGIDVFRG